MIASKYGNALTTVRAGLQRATPIVHGVRRWTDLVGAVASSPAGDVLPGAGIVRGVARAVGAVDNALQKKFAK